MNKLNINQNMTITATYKLKNNNYNNYNIIMPFQINLIKINLNSKINNKIFRISMNCLKKNNNN